MQRAGEMQDEPLVQAQMLGTMGRVYQSLGKYDTARPLLEQALAIRQAHLPADSVEVADALRRV